MKNTYELIKKFMNKYPMTVAWRLKEHAKVIDRHIDSDEEILYAFCGQKNERNVDICNTYIVALTNKRIMLASKRLLFNRYFFKTITPDMYNDLTINQGMIWGKIIIDTIKEKVLITNLSKKSLDEIETNITNIMIKLKKQYAEERKESKENE